MECGPQARLWVVSDIDASIFRPAELDFWAGMDAALRDDGGCSVAGGDYEC